MTQGILVARFITGSAYLIVSVLRVPWKERAGALYVWGRALMRLLFSPIVLQLFNFRCFCINERCNIVLKTNRS